MASKFYVSPRLFAQILPLQLPALKSCGRRLAAVDRISLSETRSDWWWRRGHEGRHHRCTADISWRGARLQWLDLGKKSKANVKFWSHLANSESKNLKKYSTRSFPLGQKINIPHVTDIKKRTLSNLQSDWISGLGSAVSLKLATSWDLNTFKKRTASLSLEGLPISGQPCWILELMEL